MSFWDVVDAHPLLSAFTALLIADVLVVFARSIGRRGKS